MKLENIFDAVPEDINEELVQLIAQSENIKIERIVSKGHASPETGWYDQKKNEWVLLLKGSAIVEFEDGSKVDLLTGNHFIIKAHEKHRVKWTDPDIETIWLAVHY